jgi:hypothetical protein
LEGNLTVSIGMSIDLEEVVPQHRELGGGC